MIESIPVFRHRSPLTVPGLSEGHLGPGKRFLKETDTN